MWIRTADPNTVESGRRLCEDLLRVGDRPDGLVINDDVLARGVLRALLDRHVNVPDDLAVITHSNAGSDGMDFPVTLTCLETDPAEMIEKAAEMLVQLMSGRPPAECTRLVGPHLVRGESC